MRKHKQLFIHDPENKVYGDCFRTCLACLLDRKPAQVPHFFDCGEEGEARECFDAAHAWLGERGLGLYEWPLNGSLMLDEALAWIHHYGRDSYTMLTGASIRGTNHTVIVHDGKIVHDPSPLGTDPATALVGPAHSPDGDKYWFIGVLVHTVSRAERTRLALVEETVKRVHDDVAPSFLPLATTLTKWAHEYTIDNPDATVWDVVRFLKQAAMD